MIQPETGSADWVNGVYKCQGETNRLCKKLHRIRPMLWDWYRTSGIKCIREHEGPWRDPNAPYYGGFQANWDFHWYGHSRKVNGEPRGFYRKRWGTADNWPLSAQIHMALRGWRERGMAPWPTTRHMCGV